MLDEKDIRIDTSTYAIKNCKITMKLIHIPTGLSVEDVGYMSHKLKEKLLSRLNDRVHTYKIFQPAIEAVERMIVIVEKDVKGKKYEM